MLCLVQFPSNHNGQSLKISGEELLEAVKHICHDLYFTVD